MIWLLAWLAGLAFLLILQVPTPLQHASSEHLYHELASRWLVLICLVLVVTWAIHRYQNRLVPESGKLWERHMPVLLTLAFVALFHYENNWDLDIRENILGICVAGILILPLFLLPLAWFHMKERNGLLLSLFALFALFLLAFSQIVDYHHDHSGEGSEILEELAEIKGMEETLEYYTFLALFQSLLPLAVLKDVAVRSLVKGPHWHRLLGALAILSVGNGLWLGHLRDGWWFYLHIFGAGVAFIGLALALRELRDFARNSPHIESGLRKG